MVPYIINGETFVGGDESDLLPSRGLVRSRRYASRVMLLNLKRASSTGIHTGVLLPHIGRYGDPALRSPNP